MIAGGYILVGFLGIYLLIGVPILTGLFMKWYWRLSNKQYHIESNTPYYKDVFPFLVILILALVILICSFYLLIRFFDFLFPATGYSS